MVESGDESDSGRESESEEGPGRKEDHDSESDDEETIVPQIQQVALEAEEEIVEDSQPLDLLNPFLPLPRQQTDPCGPLGNEDLVDFGEGSDDEYDAVYANINMAPEDLANIDLLTEGMYDIDMGDDTRKREREEESDEEETEELPVSKKNRVE